MTTDKASDPSRARHDDDEIPDEIDFSGGVRGKYYERFKDGYTVRIVTDEEDRRRQARLAAEHGRPDMGQSQITRSQDVMGGTPVFAGTRVPVEILFEYIESDEGLAGFLEQYPGVSREQAVAVLDEAKQGLLA